MQFNTRLKSLRQKNRLTQEELANILDLKPTAISNYESGRNEPCFHRLVALSKYFDVTCDYLLGITENYTPNPGEIIDKDMVECFDLYRQLSPKNVSETKAYMRYLLHKQNTE